MTTKPALNLYGDAKTPTASGHGVDISSQRTDDLDDAALAEVRRLFETNAVRPLVFDLGCGFGAHSARLAVAGAAVVAFDLDDNREQVAQRAAEVGLAGQVNFVQMDIRKGLAPLQLRPDVIYSQRTLHYLTFDEAKTVLTLLAGKNTEPMSFFLSASGLNSELGQRYPGRDVPVEQRHAELSSEMQEKHAIYGPVCLYTVDDMAQLINESGLTSIRIYASPFGNIKAIAMAAKELV